MTPFVYSLFFARSTKHSIQIVIIVKGEVESSVFYEALELTLQVVSYCIVSYLKTYDRGFCKTTRSNKLQ